MIKVDRTGGFAALVLAALLASPEGRLPAALAGSLLADDPPPCPETPAVAVVDTLHGVPIPDPYRWLEDGGSEAVRAWTEAQNRHTAERLGDLDVREGLRERLEALLGAGSLKTPRPHGDRLFFERRDPGQDQAQLCWQPAAGGEARICIDVNAFSEDGTAAMDWWAPSPDGRLVAYGISRDGSENSTLRVRDVDAGTDLEPAIPRARHAEVAWDSDGRGFFYCRYPAAGEVPPGEETYHRTLHHHRLGTHWSEDPAIWTATDKADWVTGKVSPDGRWLLVEEAKSRVSTRIFLRDLSRPTADWVTVIDGADFATSGFVVADRVILRTEWRADKRRVMSAGVDAPGQDRWRELVPEGRDALTDLGAAGGRLFARYLRDARSLVRVFDLDGTFVDELELPALGTASLPAGQWGGAAAYFGFESFFHPPASYRYDIAGGRTTPHAGLQLDVDVSPYIVEQIWFASDDGTRVPMFVTRRRDIRLDGDNPTVLTGYGGFAISRKPSFSRTRMVLLEKGFVVASVNLRGGGEYGRTWHDAGRLGNKQNVFDDCIAAAETLVDRGYTRPERLALMGRSNGGLLVGAVVVQRPDLFRAAICSVPLLDMLRYHRFLIARLWIPEYGTAESPEDFAWLRAYSPYHCVEEGTAYPAVLLTAAESDMRVDPLHARKMTAALQAAQGAADRPILLRVETKAGHGAGKPVSMVVDDFADQWSFLCWQLGVE